MKSFRIHLIWSLVTIVTSAVWAQRAVRSREVEFLERERILQGRMVTVEAARIVPTPPAEPPAPVVAPPAPLPENPAPEYEVVQEKRLTLEQIRALLRSGTRDDGWAAHQAISRMVKSPLRSELFLELLKNKDSQIRRSVLHQISEVLEAAAATALCLEYLRDDPGAEVREAAAHQLRRQPESPGAAQALLVAFQKDELRVQVACAAVLNYWGQPSSATQLIPRLAAAMESPDGAVRRESIELLTSIESPLVLPVLTRCLRDSNGDVRSEALNGLYDYDEAQVLPLVEPLLNDPVQNVRDTAKELIESIKRKKE